MPSSAFTYNDKCKEINRQYMLNNNADLDNGVYNENEEQKKQPDNTTKLDDLTGLNE